MDMEEGIPLKDVTKPGIAQEQTLGDDVGEPESYRSEALMAILCFFPTGVVSLYHSWLVQQLYVRGDSVGAVRASEQAHYFIILTRRVSAFFCLCLLVFFAAALLLGLCFAIDYNLH